MKQDGKTITTNVKQIFTCWGRALHGGHQTVMINGQVTISLDYVVLLCACVEIDPRMLMFLRRFSMGNAVLECKNIKHFPCGALTCARKL